MSILEKLKSTSRHSKIIDWPGNDEIKVKLKTSTEADYIDATKGAEAVFKGIDIKAHNVEKYDSEFEDQLLMRACFDPESDKPLTNDIRAFKELLTPEVKDALAEELDQLHLEFAPNPDKISDAEYNKIVAEVKKNVRNTVGSISNISLLKRLIITLVDQSSN